MSARETPLVFEEDAPSHAGFAAHFERHVAPALRGLEAERLRLNAALWRRVAITVTFLVAGAVVLYSFYGWRNDYFYWGLGIWAVVGLFLVWLTRRPVRRYARRRKETLIPAVLRFFGEFSYFPHGRIAPATLRDSHLFDDWNSYGSEDLIVGTHRGRRFEFAEARVRRTRPKDARRRFRGYLLALNLPGEAEGVTIAFRRDGTAFADIDKVAERVPGLAPVEIGKPAFDEAFQVYANRAEEARALITDELVTALGGIAGLHDAHGVEFGVAGETFMLKIAAGRDLFDPARIWRTALATDDARRVLAEVGFVLAIVDSVAGADST